VNGINSFIIGFCSSCVLLGFLYILCPSGNMSKVTKYIFCLCFVCCVVGTIVSVSKPDFSYFEHNKNIEILNQQQANSVANMIFSEALSSNNINFRKIDITTNKLSDGSIVISRVTVFTSEDSSKVSQVIASDDYEVVVINE
jgi:hypothetical protein